MKLQITLIAILLPLFIFSQDVVGKWKTIDDETGNAKSIVEIYEEDGKYFGKIVEILVLDKKDSVCTLCEGDKKDQPILGMVILTDLEKDDDEWNDGKILDPNNGETYSCYISLESNDKLKVRGYIGFSLLGRTQYWHKVK